MNGHARWGVLGGVWAEVDGARIDLGRQSRLVLALLLREPGRPVAVDRLARPNEATSTDRAVAAARMAVSRLRAQLATTAADGYVGTAAGGYVIDVDPLTVDHIAFAQRLRDAQATEWPDVALDRIDEALAIWQGEPFGEYAADEALVADARALAELHRSAVDSWCELALQAGRHRAALARLEAAAAAEPLREQRWSALILAHYRCGNQSQALREYERARALLREQVGVDPGAALQQLATRILDQDPELSWRPARQRIRSRALASLTQPSVLLGRDADVADVLELVERHRVVTIAGFGGIGKSSLAVEVARQTARPVWAVALAGVQRPEGVVREVAHAVGAGGDLDDTELVGAIADKLEPNGLLLLDNCEHVVDAVRALVMELVGRAPGSRLLTTSRVELDVAGGVAFVPRPLATGTADAPGPAALIAADFAMIPASDIADRWDDVAAICRQADGVPLALELLGAATMTGAFSGAQDAVVSAVGTAIDSLDADARDVVGVLAALPSDAGAALVGGMLARDEMTIRRQIGFGSRAGLIVEHSAGESTRARLLEPTREVIVEHSPPNVGVVPMLHRTITALAHDARPSLIEPPVEAVAVVIDDEHHNVLWLLEQLPPREQFHLVCALGPTWRALRRSAEGAAWFDRVASVVDDVAPVEQARYWVVRTQITPSLATRVPMVDRLRWAMETARDHGAFDVSMFAGAELVIGLGLSGDGAGALALLTELGAQIPQENRWAHLVIDHILGMGVGFAGQPVQGAEDLIRVAEGMGEIGRSADAVNSLYLASTFAQIAGDDALTRRALQIAEAHPVDRFTAYSHAALTYQRAQLAVRDGDPDAGRLLWDALGRLSDGGEYRPAEVCRRELGAWRLRQGDRGGVVDLAHAARALVTHDPSGAAVAIAVLVGDPEVAARPRWRAVLGAAVGELMEAPEGLPLAAAEQALVEARRCETPVAGAAGDVEGVLLEIERDARGHSLSGVA